MGWNENDGDSEELVVTVDEFAHEVVGSREVDNVQDANCPWVEVNSGEGQTCDS